MAPARVWIEATRPRTLAAGVVPVVVGTAAAPRVIASRAGAALVVALALQVAVNFANDLFDAARGVDALDRVGPRRAVATGLVDAREMRVATTLAFAVAAVAGLALAAAVGYELVVVGALCFAAALGYSGGPRPYGSAALGEVFVFLFFGVVATVGSFYVQAERVNAVALAASAPVGLLAAAILAANNVRDVDGDRRAGKRTLAVRLGERRARLLHRALIAAAFACTVVVALAAGSPRPLVGWLALPAARAPLELIGRRDASALIGALVATARLELVFGVLLAAGLWTAR